MKRDRREFECERINCFGCKAGVCEILELPTERQPCPFFKTRAQYAEDRQHAAQINEAHEAVYRDNMLIMQSDKAKRGSDKHQKNRREEESGF